MSLCFEEEHLYQKLLELSLNQRDELEIGVIELSPDLVCTAYNRTESRFSGLSPERVVGKHFFDRVAPCMNNHLVRGRFAETHLDLTLDYVLSARMKPTPVRLRLLTREEQEPRFLIVEIPEKS